MSLRPRAAPVAGRPAGQPAGQPASAGRLHAVLSAGVARAEQHPPLLLPVETRSAPPSATSTAPRGRNPRVIHLDPAKADALRRTLETGTRLTKAERRTQRIKKQNMHYREVVQEVVTALEDQKISGQEIGKIMSTVSEGVDDANKSLQENAQVEDRLRSLEASLYKLEAAAEVQQSEPQEPQEGQEGQEAQKPQEAQQREEDAEGLTDEVDSLPDDDGPELQSNAELSAQLEDIIEATRRLEALKRDLSVPEDAPVVTEQTSEEKEKEQLAKKELTEGVEILKKKHKKLNLGLRISNQALYAGITALIGTISVGGLVWNLMSTAQEEIIPEVTWSTWFLAAAKDAGALIGPPVLLALTGMF